MMLRILLLFGLGLLATPLAAVPLWSVQGADRTGVVLILGSVHLLREADQPLPDAVRAAYERADRLVMEIDPAALEPAAAQAALAAVGIVSPGRSVAETLSAEQWHSAEAAARESGLDLQTVAQLEPWFAAIVLYTGALAASGYHAALGVDQQVAAWAARDGKPVMGLETLEQQLLLFKGLAADMQREMLIKTLAELAEIRSDTAALVAQWRDGDAAALAERLETDFLDYPGLHGRIVTDRNRAWLAPVRAMLESGGTTLVVVGALHLVGPEGLPALFEEAGYRVAPLGAR
jgi:uncharacterized protein